MHGDARATAARVARRAWLLARRPLLVTTLYLLAWYPLDLAAQQFQTAREISVWYPPFGLNVALLLVCGLRYWPLLLLNTLIHDRFVAPRPLPVPTLLVFDLITTVGSVGACGLLRRVLHIDPRLRHRRDVTLFVAVACVGAPFVVALLQVLNLALAGVTPWGQVAANTTYYWAGDATGVGLLAPALLVLLRPWPRLWATPDGEMNQARDPALTEDPDQDRGPAVRVGHVPAPRRWSGWRPTPWEILEGLAEAGGLALALLAAYGAPRGGTLDFTYALFVPLVWIAVRHGFARAAVAVLLLNAGAALLARDQVGRTNGLAVQFGLLTLTLTGLLLGAVMGERRLLGVRLAHQALHDPLTGLANRVLLRERVAHALARRAASLAVLFVDLDHFKDVNDSLGHAAGDRVLVAAARRLSDCVRPADTVARLGGDEFAVLLDDAGDPRAAVEVAERILNALCAPVPVEGRTLHPSASIGITFHAPGPAAVSADTLLRDADVALYRAKERRGGYQVFDASMHAAVLERLELEADLRRAIDRDAEGFVLYYQPLVALETGQITGVEALVRWRHPTRGLLHPDAFIPLAEETGLIVPLGQWVVRAACREVQGWPAPAAAALPTVGVNLSVEQVRHGGLVADVAAALREGGLAPDRLMLEITESVLAHDVAAARDTLRALRALGVQLALDDFGTGYSSLGYLREFPIDVLKMDRAFLADVGRDATGTALAGVIVALGRTLGLVTVAEGIERADQYAQMRALGCTRGQGYYLARPLPPAEARALVAVGVPLIPSPATPSP